MENKTCLNRFLDICSKFPQRNAIIYKDKKLTYSELNSRASSLAYGFNALNFQNKKVCILLPTCPELVVTYYAGFKAGVHLIPLNYSFKYLELANVLKNSRPHVFIFHAAMIEELSKIDPEILQAIPHKFIVGNPIDDSFFIPFTFSNFNLLFNKSVLRGGKNSYQSRIIFHTSGTTGIPKGAIHSLESISYFSMCYAYLCKNETRPVTVISRNCYHSGGFFHLTGALATGTTCILSDSGSRFDVEDYLELLVKYQATQIFLNVGMLNKLFQSPNISSNHFKHATFISAGADKVEPFHHEELKKYSDLPLIVRYSSTEATCVSINDSPDEEVRKNTVGKPFPHFKFKLYPIQGTNYGELWLHGKSLFKGYYNNARATEEALSEAGWYRTGDLFSIDRQGNFVFIGRKINSIKVTGKIVYPQEIEAVANSFQECKQTIAVPVTDDIHVQVPFLFVKAKVHPQEFPFPAFKKFLKERLSYYKVPVYMKLIEDFPLNSGGKIDRKFLKKEAEYLHLNRNERF